MFERKWLTSEALLQEFVSWPESNRNEKDLRFGQHLFNKFEGVPSHVFFVENFREAHQMLLDHLEDVQR